MKKRKHQPDPRNMRHNGKQWGDGYWLPKSAYDARGKQAVPKRKNRKKCK